MPSTLTLLLLAYLEGEENSAEILSDFLEETGQPRIDGSGSHPNESVVWQCVTSENGWLLACDFAQRVLGEFEAIRPQDTRLADAIDIRRKWVFKTATNDDLWAHRDIVGKALFEAETPQVEFEERQSTASAWWTAIAVRNVVLNLPVNTAIEYTAKDAMRAWAAKRYQRDYRQELLKQERHWQIEHTKRFLQS